MKLIDIEIDGKPIKVQAKKSVEGLWIHFNGQTYLVEAKASSKRTGKSTQAESHQISSKMPGKIIKVNKKAGDTVKIGEVVVIMEAMKMEYSLEARKSGKVKLIKCKEGDQIKPNIILVETE